MPQRVRCRRSPAMWAALVLAAVVAPSAVVPAIPAKAESEPPLRVLVSAALSVPYLDMRVDGTPAGIVPTLARAIAEMLGHPATIQVVPRRRIEAMLADGRGDLACHTHPTWLEAPERLLWTGGPYPVDTVLFGDGGAPPVADVGEFRGEVVAVQGALLQTLEQGTQSHSEASG